MPQFLVTFTNKEWKAFQDEWLNFIRIDTGEEPPPTMKLQITIPGKCRVMKWYPPKAKPKG